ncbi:PREDICTED: uncharacterized protein LOC104789220 [Camelina sativa]|uniref:Uncharacterized protein LOC104789220 n=1 Tax=Camelina sativa TaxID=90675 RepID=A0ABM0ZBG9_CAMSA|nr:PREDICTED: uncharacterized protein LOC104789220 [Camelina sativa]
MAYDDFLGMVYEDFGLERKSVELQLSYKLSRKKAADSLPEDTPPVFVCNGRQLEGFIRQCKAEAVRRMCVQIEGKGLKEDLMEVKEESRPNLYVVQCWVSGCKWRMRASTIASVVPVHVAEALNLRYGLKVDYWKGHRTLKRARELVRGSYENGYAELPAYLYRIRRSNPGTMTRLKVDENDRFKSVFIAFGASIDGFKFMRKVIVVDGTFLKGKYLGTLLLAKTQDGNYNIFPLAFAIVDTENDESWDWFFTQLSCVIPDDEGIVIISDSHKSIGKAVDINYPLANRGICTYHLHKNIMLRFRGSETFGLVKKAATAYRLSDFNVLLGQIEEMNPELYAYLQRADVSKWSRVHFPGDRYNITTTNIAESLNKVLRPARSFPIAQLLDEIRSMLTRWFARRRVEAAQMSTVLTNGVEKLLQERVRRASFLQVQEIDSYHYEVRSGTSVNVVNLSQRRCSCRVFDVDNIPCIHAIAAAEKANVSRISKCDPYFRVDYLRPGIMRSL